MHFACQISFVNIIWPITSIEVLEIGISYIEG